LWFDPWGRPVRARVHQRYDAGTAFSTNFVLFLFMPAFFSFYYVVPAGWRNGSILAAIAGSRAGKPPNPRIVAPASGIVPRSRLGEMRTRRIGPRYRNLYRTRRHGDRKSLLAFSFFEISPPRNRPKLSPREWLPVSTCPTCKPYRDDIY
jgi:hypothetical protein